MGLLSGVLPAVYSASDTLKRKVGGLLSDPVGTLQQHVGLLNDNARSFNQLHSKATQESVNSIKGGGSGFGPASQQLAGKLADAYNPMGMVVWHGSPHKFSKFDSSKIGTGEGAQAYGHGLYLAESPDVAGSYAKMGYSKHRRAHSMDESLFLDRWNTVSELEKQKAAGVTRFGVKWDDIWERRLKEALADAEKRGPRPENLYKVDLPDDAIAKMLDWDKPLSQQDFVQRAMLNQDDAWKAYASQLDDQSRALAEDMVLGKKPVHDGSEEFWSQLLKKHPNLDHNEIHDVRWRMNPQTDDLDWLTGVLNGNSAVGAGVRGGGGADLYNSLGGGDTAASKLRELGIPGIRYLDGGSRGAGSGTSNFVVFPGNEGLLSILERNGQPIK